MAMTQKTKLILTFILFIGLGVSIGLAYVTYKPNLAQWFLFKPTHYRTSNTDLERTFEATKPLVVQWSQLLPESEKAVLKRYQQQPGNNLNDLTENILRSLEASTDAEYGAAMTSLNTVDAFDGQAVSIAGFIVPIDYHDDKSVSNLFIVPYFGACLHFPPPPPNQIIFSQLGKGFNDLEITQAYRLHGIMRRGLFEDPMGTSAYILDVVSIETYYEEPDDFRQH